MSQEYFSELEKIANDIAADIPEEPMTEEHAPAPSPEEVEAAQALNAEPPEAEAAKEQLPPSPEEADQIVENLELAKQELEAAEEQLAEALYRYEQFDKVAAPALNESLPAMGALAKLIDYSTNKDADPELHKLAQERLSTALTTQEKFFETLHKTASELFEDEDNLNALYSDEGLAYVTEQLASFEEDEELNKIALDGGNIIGKVVDTVKDYASATKNYFKLKDELNAASKTLEAASDSAQKKYDAYQKMQQTLGPNDFDSQNAYKDFKQSFQDQTDARRHVTALADQTRKGAQVLGAGGALAAGGALYGGKKLYDARHPEEEFIDQTNPQFIEGGNQKMASQIVHDFLKIAGAASLIDIANNDQLEPGIRKEAADQFNYISRLPRRQMDDSFVKVATQLYTEQEMHEIVAGYHTEELFDKVAFFLAANEASADELEKVAGADGVAAKGVAGSMAESAENIEAVIKEEKEKASSQAEGRRNVVDPGDTDAYNVINNPEKYKVEKTAMIEQAVLQKQAAIQAYNEAEDFLRYYC